MSLRREVELPNVCQPAHAGHARLRRRPMFTRVLLDAGPSRQPRDFGHRRDAAPVVALAALLLLTSLHAFGYENIPTQLDARAFLTRLAARGVAPIDAPISEPLTRGHLAGVMQVGLASLSTVERQHLSAYSAYAHNAADGATAAYAADGFSLAFDPWVVFDGQRRSGEGGVTTASSIRPVAYGGTTAFRFYTEFEWGVVSNASAYRFPPDKYPLRQASITGDLEQLSMVQGHVAFGSGPMVVQVGKLPVRWGMGWRGSLLLSDNTDAKDGVRLLVRTGPFRFESLTAAMPQAGVEKYVSAHRLSVRPHGRLAVGVHEAVVYSGALRMNYLNPFNLYLLAVPIVERQTRGEDREEFPGGNGLFGVDVTWRVGDSSVLYVDSVVDDYQPQRGLDSIRNWDSKYAVQFGAYVVDPFGLRDTDVRAEYTFVNQYAYTHEFEALPYTLGGRPLGFFTGPDADDLYLGATKWLTPHVRVAANVSQTRKGEQDITEPRLPGGPQTWTFLSGVEETRRVFGVGVRVTEVTRWRAELVAEYGRVLNVGHVDGDDRDGIDILLSGAYRL